MVVDPGPHITLRLMEHTANNSRCRFVHSLHPRCVGRSCWSIYWTCRHTVMHLRQSMSSYGCSCCRGRWPTMSAAIGLRDRAPNQAVVDCCIWAPQARSVSHQSHDRQRRPSRWRGPEGEFRTRCRGSDRMYPEPRARASAGMVTRDSTSEKSSDKSGMQPHRLCCSPRL
jgi:hypothetical protein